LQGDNDPRVPKEESQQVIDLLKKDGKTVDVHYPSRFLNVKTRSIRYEDNRLV
jgi:hypothetical protein